MKKYLFPFLFTASIGLNFYLLSGDTEMVVNDDLDDALYEEVNDQISVAQSAVKKKDLTALKNKHHKQNIKLIEKEFGADEDQNAETYTEDTVSEEHQQNYEQSKLKWEEDLLYHFENELRLGEETYEAYLELTRLRQKEVSDYMTPKLEGLGDDPYLFTLEDNIEMGKINSKYLKRLKDMMGEDAYAQYIQYRQNYNKNLINSGNGHFYVEF